MHDRLEFHNLLCSVLGSNNVYYQPPETIKMRYPSIVYSMGRPYTRHANNSVYNKTLAYEVTVIDKNPDSDIVENISALPMCSFNRRFSSDNLNHTVFTIYY